jgi:7-cyano-7-deazaguanine synthase
VSTHVPAAGGRAIAVLTSGGLDSAILVADLINQDRIVQPIYIRFGLAWEQVEEAHLRRFLSTLPGAGECPLITLELPIADVYGDHWSTSGEDVPDARSPDEAVYLPGRNVLLLAKSSVWCSLHDVRTIALGTLKGNPFPDSSAGFFGLFGSLAQMALSSPLEVVTPFAGLSKIEVLELGHGLDLHHTFSCIEPKAGLHCGQCNKCAERRHAFDLSQTPDATRYAEP